MADENRRLCRRLRLDEYHFGMSKYSRDDTGCNDVVSISPQEKEGRDKMDCVTDTARPSNGF